MLIFFFIALLVNFGKTVTPDEEVRQMLAELEIVSGPTMDVASTLKKVTKVSMPFLQDIHSVSNLAAAGMSLQGETGPKNTAEMDLNIERLRNSMNYDQSLREYGNVVTLNLDIIEPTLLRVINPEEDPPIWRDDFVRACNNMIVALTSMSVKMANQKMARLRT
uniref:Acriflavin resistance protein n=1 Tax=Globodera pallida TaxID=36090 RepID=A0A183CN79_GLOPA